MEKKAAKVCIYAKGSNILTAVFSVDAIINNVFIDRVGCHSYPQTNGTTIFSQCLIYDPMILHAPKQMGLTAYEKYLNACGFNFVCTLPECKGKSVRDAFLMARTFIKGLQRNF